MRTRTYLIFWTALAISVVLVVALSGCSSSREINPNSPYIPHIQKANASTDCFYLSEHWRQAVALKDAKHGRGISADDEMDYMYAVDDRMREIGCP